MTLHIANEKKSSIDSDGKNSSTLIGINTLKDLETLCNYASNNLSFARTVFMEDLVNNAKSIKEKILERSLLAKLTDSSSNDGKRKEYELTFQDENFNFKLSYITYKDIISGSTDPILEIYNPQTKEKYLVQVESYNKLKIPITVVKNNQTLVSPDKDLKFSWPKEKLEVLDNVLKELMQILQVKPLIYP